MVIITGDSRSRKVVAFLKERGWGRMFVQSRFTPYPGEPWGFDNGAFIWWRRGQEFDGGVFYRRLKVAYEMGMPYLAVTPDIVAGGMASLDFSLGYMRHVLPQDWPWYLAVQDGMTPELIEPHLGKFAGIFLGGTDAFKLTAPEWCNLAHQHGMKFHFARVNKRRLRFSLEVGADSCDGTALLWEEGARRRFAAALEVLREHQTLFETG